jgi:hypothetical protein
VQAPDAAWPPQAKQWYERALASFRALDSDDAEQSIQRALKLQPKRAEVRELAARIALAQLNFDAALEHTKGLGTKGSRAVRGRALWYKGQLAEAAEELDLLLADPSVKDPWAQGVVKLAHSGQGRTPFTLSGERLAVVDMTRLASTAMVIPVELEGRPVNALISTGTAEVVVDSAGGSEPSWVNLRFAERLEVKDVPALTQDLSGISRDLNQEIKVLLGANLLRRLNVTFDFLGRQFVVRNYDPPPPPVATKLPLQYIRGGGMVLRGQIGQDAEAPQFTLFVDTASTYPIVLDEPAWARTRIDPAKRTTLPGRAGVSQAPLPALRLGAFGLNDVTAFGGVPLTDLERGLDIELDGLLGSAILGAFRVTLADNGLTMWLEDGLPSAPPAAQPAAEPQAPLEAPSGEG